MSDLLCFAHVVLVLYKLNLLMVALVKGTAFIYYVYAVLLHLCSSSADCLGTFGDFNFVCGDAVDRNSQYIIPQLNFSYNGTVTQWKVGLTGGGNSKELHLQIWRSSAQGQFSLVNDTTYTKTANEGIATVPVSMSVMAGDMVGFYVPKRQLRLHTAPDVGITIYSTKGSSTSSLTALQSVVGPSPFISVVFGERFTANIH